MSRLAVFGGSALLSLCFSLFGARSASAGVCYEPDVIEASLKDFERYAAKGGKGGKLPEGEWGCAQDFPKLHPRLAAACQRIVEGYDHARVVEFGHPDFREYLSQVLCIEVLVEAKILKVGDVDPVAILMARGKWGITDPVAKQWKRLAASGDPRVRAFLVEKMRLHLDALGKKPLKGWRARAWYEWQSSALLALGKLGEASDLPLIDEIVASGKDKRLPKLAAKAKEAINARASSPSVP